MLMTRNVEKLNCIIVLYSNKISLWKVGNPTQQKWLNTVNDRFAPPVGHVLELDTLLAT